MQLLQLGYAPTISEAAPVKLMALKKEADSVVLNLFVFSGLLET